MIDWSMVDKNNFELLDEDGARIGTTTGENAAWWAVAIVHAMNDVTERHLKEVEVTLGNKNI